MDQTIQSQNARLEEMQTVVQQQAMNTQKMQADMQSMHKSFHQEVASAMELQTARLEALLEKRAKHT